MTERSYICDLCKWKTSDATTIVGFEWSGAWSTVKVRPAYEVERHICRDCIKAITNISEQCQ